MRLMITLALTWCAIGAHAQRMPELSSKSLERYRKFIEARKSEERWRAIPWKVRFWDGVIEAHKKKRPIFLWAMNGHPMGCT